MESNEILSEEQLIDWCKEHFPEEDYRLPALLSTFSPDLEELEEYDISVDGDGAYTINGCDYYVTENSFEDLVEDIKQQYYDSVADALYEYPSIFNYIDWTSFWEENSSILDVDNVEEVKFAGTFYCIEE